MCVWGPPGRDLKGGPGRKRRRGCEGEEALAAGGDGRRGHDARALQKGGKNGGQGGGAGGGGGGGGLFALGSAGRVRLAPCGSPARVRGAVQLERGGSHLPSRSGDPAAAADRPDLRGQGAGPLRGPRPHRPRAPPAGPLTATQSPPPASGPARPAGKCGLGAAVALGRSHCPRPVPRRGSLTATPGLSPPAGKRILLPRGHWHSSQAPTRLALLPLEPLWLWPAWLLGSGCRCNWPTLPGSGRSALLTCRAAVLICQKE